ncbi:site-specific integrase [Lachnospiraceae bacterium LCP25S3_G4]
MAYQVLYFCGLRIGALFALVAEDIDLSENVIHITKSLQRVKKADIITPPKSEKGIRDITIPDFLSKELEIYMNMIYDCKGKTRLFEISKQKLYYPMKKYSEIADVPKIRIHDLRHSHVALLIEQGVLPLAIAQRLGHEDVSITLGTYGHLYPNKQREIAGILGKLEI